MIPFQWYQIYCLSRFVGSLELVLVECLYNNKLPFEKKWQVPFWKDDEIMTNNIIIIPFWRYLSLYWEPTLILYALTSSISNSWNWALIFISICSPSEKCEKDWKFSSTRNIMFIRFFLSQSIWICSVTTWRCWCYMPIISYDWFQPIVQNFQPDIFLLFWNWPAK